MLFSMTNRKFKVFVITTNSYKYNLRKRNYFFSLFLASMYGISGATIDGRKIDQGRLVVSSTENLNESICRKVTWL